MNAGMDNKTMDTDGMRRLDDAIRGHHAAAVAQVSPRVRAQLAQRRNAALRGQPAGQAARHGHGFRYAAAAFAAVAALAIGLNLDPARVPAAAAPAQAVATASPSAASGTNATVLDEDPDFYAWLASDDSRMLAME